MTKTQDQTPPSDYVLLDGDTKINRVAYGALRLPALQTTDGNSLAQSRLLLQRAVKLGVNLIDTADFYGPYVANRLIAEALYPYPSNLVIATKVGVRVGKDNKPEPAARPEDIRTVCKDNLKRLRLSQLDLVFLRLPGGPLVDSGVPLSESLGALVELRAEGKVHHIGLSSATAEQLSEARAITTIAAVQNLFNLGNQGSADVLDICTREGIVFMPYFPLEMGKFAGKETSSGILQTIAQSQQATIAQVILAWLLARSAMIVVIPGTSSSRHLEENVAAASLQLSASDFQALQQLK